MGKLTCREKTGFLAVFGGKTTTTNLHECENNFLYHIDDSIKKIASMANDEGVCQYSVLDHTTE